MSNVKDLTKADYESTVSKNAGVSLIKFGAEWCGPCKTLAPVMEELGNDYVGKVDVYDVNVDVNQELAAEFGVRGIPAVFLVQAGEVKQSWVGVQSKNTFSSVLDSMV